MTASTRWRAWLVGVAIAAALLGGALLARMGPALSLALTLALPGAESWLAPLHAEVVVEEMSIEAGGRRLVADLYRPSPPRGGPLRGGAEGAHPREAPRVARRFRGGPAGRGVAGRDRGAEAGRPGRRPRRAGGRSGWRGPRRARARAEPPRGRRRHVAGRAARGGARGDRATFPARRDPAARRAPADRPRRRRRLDSVHREPAAGGGGGPGRRRRGPRGLRAHAAAV